MEHVEKTKENQRQYYKKKTREQYQKNKNLPKRTLTEAERLLRKEYMKNYGKKYKYDRRRRDEAFRIAHNLRSRLPSIIRHSVKSGSFVRDLGCSVEELKSYLESKFQPGMSWGNYGLYGWHIDHISPLVKFDLTKREELLKAVNYTNLQPLWAKDNLSKGFK